MKLTRNGLLDREAWNKAGIALPSYDTEAVRQKTLAHPVWVHFGIGNIFRIFLGTAADDLIAQGLLDRGIICAETFDFEVVDKVYRPHNDLALCVTLFGDGTSDQRVIGSLCESAALRPGETIQRIAGLHGREAEADEVRQPARGSGRNEERMPARGRRLFRDAVELLDMRDF